MKKIIFLIIFINFSFAKIEGLSELLLFLFPKITDKKIIKIYTLPKYYIYFKNPKFKLVIDCNKSDIVFGNISCLDKPVFALSYRFYKKNNHAFGVFYYRKGRPQLKLKKEILKKYFKKIPNEIKGHVE